MDVKIVNMLIYCTAVLTVTLMSLISSTLPICACCYLLHEGLRNVHTAQTDIMACLALL